MNPADPKWLEILKASGWQTSGLTVAFLIFIVLARTETIPTTESPLWIALPTLGALICGCLALASIGDALTNAVKPARRIDTWRRKRHDKKATREFIPYMTNEDRAIIGYLLYHNQKMFQHDLDGGYAAPLISKGMIRCALKPGQVFEERWVPFYVPDHIWDVLTENREGFPYEPPQKGKTEIHPWAIHWMAK